MELETGKDWEGNLIGFIAYIGLFILWRFRKYARANRCGRYSETVIAGVNMTMTANAPTETQEPTVTPTLAFTETPAFTPTITNTPPPPLPTGPVSCIPNNPPQTGKVVDIVDGDTIKVLLDQNGLTYVVRYIGMDTPENTTNVEHYGPEATARNTELVYRKAVELYKDVSETDVYNRLMRYVVADGIFVNYKLVEEGYAKVASFPPDTACIPTFQDAEQKTSVLKLGLWSPPPTLVVYPTSSGGGGGGGSFDNNGDGRVTCADFTTRAQALAALRAGYTNLDADGDGIPCESLH